MVKLIVFMVMMAAPLTSFAVTRYMATNGNDTLNSCAASQNSATPKRNLNGVDGAMACMSGGDTLIVRAGVYNERIAPFGNALPNGLGENARTVIAGAPGETVQFGPAGGQTVLVLGPGAPGGGYQYMTFENLTIDADGFGPTGPRGAFVGSDTHHIRFKNVTVRNAQMGFEGSGSYQHYIGCDVSNTYWYGWYWSGNHSIIEENNIHHNTGYGLHIFSAGNPPPTYISDNIIRNNRIHNNGFGGDGAGGDGSPAVIISHGSNNVLYNNLVYDNDVTGIQVDYWCTNCQIYNNTIVNNGGTGVTIGADNVSDTVVINNIIYNNGNTVANQGSNSAVRTNLYTNPLFTNEGAKDFSLTANSPRNNGETIAVVTTSFTYGGVTGITRPSGSQYDIGAYEYDEGGDPGPNPPNANPIYVAQTGGNDTNDCFAAESQSTPKLTITSALGCMVVPGKIMYIKAGTYAERIDSGNTPITGGNGPSYSNATIISSFGTDAVTIQPGTGFPSVWLHNGVNDKYILIKGSSANKLVFNSGSVVDSGGIVCFPGGHHIRFEHVEVKNSHFETVYNWECNNFDIVDSLIHNAGTTGVYFDGTTSNVLIQRTAIYSNGGKGVNVAGTNTTSLTMRESIVFSNGTQGVLVNNSSNFTMVNSIVHSNGGIGIQLATGAATPKLQNNTVYNNVGTGVQCDAGVTGATMTNLLSYLNGAGSVVNFTNNCSMTQTTNLTGTTNPLFVNAPSNLRVADGSIAIDAGTNIPGLTVDYAGSPRQQGTKQDIGAYEHAGSALPGPGVLRVSTANPRYFENPQGEIVYLTGAYSWNFADTMPDAEFADYLAYVVAHGYNLLRVPSQDYNGEAQVTSYFDVLASRIGQAATAGLYVQLSILPFTDPPFDNQVFNEAYARDFVRAVGSYSNIIYEVGNEMDTLALDGGTLGSFVTSMVNVINNEQSVQGFTPRRMVGISEFKADDTYNTNAATVTFTLGSVADFISLGFSQRTFQPCWIPPDYVGVKVSIPDTDHISPYQCDHKWVWKLFAMGHNPTLLDGNAFLPNESIPDNPLDTFGAAATYDARSRMGDTRTYALKLRLDMVTPQPTLSTTGYALAWTGNQYLVYQPNTGPFNVTLVAGSYTVEWFDPVAHTTANSGPTTYGTGTVGFSTPLNTANDAVLLLKLDTTPPVGPDVTVAKKSLRGRSMFFDHVAEVCQHNLCGMYP